MGSGAAGAALEERKLLMERGAGGDKQMGVNRAIDVAAGAVAGAALTHDAAQDFINSQRRRVTSKEARVGRRVVPLGSGSLD